MGISTPKLHGLWLTLWQTVIWGYTPFSDTPLSWHLQPHFSSAAPIFGQRVSPVGIYICIYCVRIYIYNNHICIYILYHIYIHYICKIIKHTGVREMRLNLQDLGLVEFVFSPKAYETSSLIIMLPCRSIPLPLTGSCVDLSPKWLGDLAAKKVKKTGQCLGRDTPEHGNCHEK